MTDSADVPENTAVCPEVRAFIAFQMADHWGNRRTPRPTPRGDVLAALLWAGPQPPPLVGGAAPTPAPPGRYPELLATELALARSDPGPTPAAAVVWRQRLGALRAALQDEPAYRQVLLTAGHRGNLAMLAICEELASRLLRGASRPFRLPGLLQNGVETELEVRPAGAFAFRLHPWPLVGSRLDVHADLPAGSGTWTRQTWTLMPTAGRVD